MLHNTIAHSRRNPECGMLQDKQSGLFNKEVGESIREGEETYRLKEM